MLSVFFKHTPAELRAFPSTYGGSIVGQGIVWILRDRKLWERAVVVPLSVEICFQEILGIVCKEGGCV